MAARRPHIVVFNPDQWRGDAVGFLGTPGVMTPNLDRLVAGEAVAFTDAHCQYTVCSPSRCSFMTGWYPHTCGHRDQHFLLRDPGASLLVQAREAGYHTAWFGKNDLFPAEDGLAHLVDHYQSLVQAPYPLYIQAYERRGEGPADDRYYGFYAGRVEDRPGQPVADDHDHQMLRAARDYIAAYAGERPLFCYVALHNPHPPYGVEEPFFSLIDRAAVAAPVPPPRDWTGLPAIMPELHRRHGLVEWTAERFRELRAAYYGMVARVDHHLGELIDALERRGIWADTALAVFSDHGDYAGDYGLVQKDDAGLRPCLTRVPLVLRPPAGEPCRPGLRATPTELVDVTATLRRWAGIESDWSEFGRDLRPALADPAHRHRAAACVEAGRRIDDPRRAGSDPGSMYWPTASIAAEGLPAGGRAVLRRTADHAYVRREHGPDEVYDLAADPDMLDNRIADPALAPVVADMKDALLDWFLATGDVVPPWRNRREP